MTSRVASNPFPGLRPFEFEDSALFFGRDRHVVALRQKLADKRFVAVVGRSGDGKSSLVAAGLRPNLAKARDADDAPLWLHDEMQPHGDPMGNLARLVDRLAIHKDPSLADHSEEIRLHRSLAMLSRSSDGLSRLLTEIAPKETGTSLLLVIDQFEELFRFIRPTGEKKKANNTELLPRLDDATAFVRLLLDASKSKDCNAHIILTMRSDFLGECTQFPGLAEAINDSQFLVPRLTRSERKSVIYDAVSKAGGTIDPRLVQRLLNDAGEAADMLPVLQHTMMRLWDVASARTTPPEIEIDDYSTTGQLNEALSNHADTIFAALSDAAQKAAEISFRAMVELDDSGRSTRRTPPPRVKNLVALCGGDTENLKSPSNQPLLEFLQFYRERNVHILRPAEPEELKLTTQIDISHEAVIWRWSRLKRWVAQEAEDATMWRRLINLVDTKADFLPEGARDRIIAWFDKKEPSPVWAKRYDVPAQNDRYKKVVTLINASKQWKLDQEAARHAKEQAERDRKIKERRLRTWKFASIGTVALLLGLVAFTLRVIELRDLAEEAQNKAIAAADAALKAEAEAVAAAVRERETAERARTLRIDAENAREIAQTRLNEVIEAQAARQAAEADAERTQLEQRAQTILSRILDELGKDEDPRPPAAALQSLLDEYEGVLDIAELEAVAYMALTQNFWDVPPPNVLDGNEKVSWMGTFSPDGSVFVQPYSDLVRVWDTQTGRLISTFAAEMRNSSDASFGPRDVLVTALGNTATVWDYRTGEPILDLVGHADAINTVSFSPGLGTTVLTSSLDGTAKLWDATDGRVLHELSGYGDSVHFASFSPTGDTVATTSEDGWTELWEVTTGTSLWRRHGEVAVELAKFSPDGEVLATQDSAGLLAVWDVGTGQQLHKIDNLQKLPVGLDAVEFSSNSDLLLVSNRDGEVNGWSRLTGETFVRSLVAGTFYSVKLNPKNDTLLVGSSRFIRVYRNWRSSQTDFLELPTGPRGGAAVFDQYGNTILTGAPDGSARLWNAQTGEQLRVFLGGKAFKSVRNTLNGTAVEVIGLDGSKTLLEQTSLFPDWPEWVPVIDVPWWDPGPRVEESSERTSSWNDGPWRATLRATRGGAALDVSHPMYGTAEFDVSNRGDVSAMEFSPRSGLFAIVANDITLWRMPQFAMSPASDRIVSRPTAVFPFERGTARLQFDPLGRTLAIGPHQENARTSSKDTAETYVRLWPVFENQNQVIERLNELPFEPLTARQRCTFALDLEDLCAQDTVPDIELR